MSVSVPNNRNVVTLALGFGTNTSVVVPGTYAYTPPCRHSAAGWERIPLLRSYSPQPTRWAIQARPRTTRLSSPRQRRLSPGPTPAAIAVGTALSGTQLDATATFQGGPVLGTFTYTVLPANSPAMNAVLAAGTWTLQVVFAPNDTTDFTNATATVQIVVGTSGLCTLGVGGGACVPHRRLLLL